MADTPPRLARQNDMARSAGTPNQDPTTRRDIARILCAIGLAGVFLLALTAPGMQAYKIVLFGDSKVFRQVAYLSLFVLLLLTVAVSRGIKTIFCVPWWLVAPLGWCWLSLCWSAVPMVSFQRLTLLSIITWSIFLAVNTLGYRRSVRTVAVVLCMLAVVNLGTVLFMPRIGIFDFDRFAYLGLWRGFMSDKNILGAVSAITLLFMVHVHQVPKTARIGFGIVSVLLLLFSVSRTSMMMAALALLVTYLAHRSSREGRPPSEAFMKRFRLYLVILSVAIALLLVYAAFQIYDIQALIQDPAGGSNRFRIWQSMLSYYADNPIAGSGVGAYWANVDQDRAHYSNAWLMLVSQGHNGYLDLLVEVGLPGFLLALFGTVLMPLYIIVGRFPEQRQRLSVAAALLVFVWGSNFSETSILERDTVGNIFLMFALATVQFTKDLKAIKTGKRRVRQRRSRTRTAVDGPSQSASSPTLP